MIEFLAQGELYGIRWTPSRRCNLFGHGQHLKCALFASDAEQYGTQLYELIIETIGLHSDGKYINQERERLYCNSGTVVIFNEQRN